MHKAYYERIDRLIDYSKHIHLNEPTFLLDLVYDDDARSNETFMWLINSLGSPLIRNKQQEYFSIKPTGISGWTCEIMKSIRQIHDLLHDGTIQCSLYPWCANSDKNLKDEPNFKPINPTPEVCLKKPWERCSYVNLCPFAMLWKNWNLMGYIPVKI